MPSTSKSLTAVMGKVAEVVPAVMVTAAGTLASVRSLDIKVTSKSDAKAAGMDTVPVAAGGAAFSAKLE